MAYSNEAEARRRQGRLSGAVGQSKWENWPSPRLQLILTIPAVLVLLLFCLQEPPQTRWQTFAVGGLIGLAAAAVGAFLGFLFGIPKSLTTRPELQPAPHEDVQPDAPTSSQQSALTPGGFGQNTNLEEISDWLTKILVGAGLVQLGALVRGAGRLAGVLGQSMGGAKGAPILGLALLVYGLALGFLFAYIPTRVNLPRLLRQGEEASNGAPADPVQDG
jgi:hypothetical protein